MKVGDLHSLDDGSGHTSALILEIWDFKKYCDMHDERELEYDSEDAWEHWKSFGPLLVVLHPSKHVPVRVWARK